MSTTTTTRMAVPLGAFLGGAVVSVLLGVYGSVHQPTFRAITTFGFGSMIRMKVVLALLVGLFALGQLVGALWLYGKLGRPAPPWLGTAHRVSGLVAIALSLPVAYHCLWALGFQAGGGVSTRVLVHSVAGCVVYGAVVVKVVAVHAHRAPGWLLPVAGGLLFTALVLTVLTSAVYYVGANGWPTGSTY